MARGLDARKYFWRSGREKCFSLDIPFYRTSGSRRRARHLRGLGVIRPSAAQPYVSEVDFQIQDDSVCGRFRRLSRPGIAFQGDCAMLGPEGRRK
jgi:hypothetical protein